MENRKDKIFALNPGSTSTKIALYAGGEPVFIRTLEHRPEELGGVQTQLGFRREAILRAVREQGCTLENVDVFVGRGGSMYPCVGGIYEINGKMLEDARFGPFGEHPARLSSQLCDAFRAEYGGRACVVDPPDTDELMDEARVTGLKDLYRESRSHALNQKAVARQYAAGIGRRYEDLRLIVAHIGGGVSVTAHRLGRMIDTNDILHGSGPVAPTRCGDIAPGKLIELCFSGRYTEKELMNKTHKDGGLIDLLGTADVREVEKRIAGGDHYARFVLDGMIYSIAKCIGGCAVALRGEADQILLTGGVARDEYVVRKLREYCDWIAPVTVTAGEFEMEALAAGGRRWLLGEEKSRVYTGIPVWTPDQAGKPTQENTFS